MRGSYACSDPKHSGDPYIADKRDVYEIRLESRRLSDRSGRKDIVLVDTICRECVSYRMSEMAGRLPRMQQGSLGL